MKVLIIGVGLVGTELAQSLRADGHTVVGTTTTPDKADTLAEVCDEVRVLRGADREGVTAAAKDVDAIVVTAGPNAARAMTREERAATYADVLVETARSVVAAPTQAPIVWLSSLSVYGDAADHLDVIAEDAPLSGSDDPSPSNFIAAERTYLDGAGERVCVFRCADIFGGQDPPLEVKIRMAHEVLGGTVPFDADALLYRVHVSDVVAAVRHALEHGLRGIYNLTHDGVPARNSELFDAVSAQLGFEPLTYRGELKGPGAPVSTDKLQATGFALQHTRVEHSPAGA